MSIVRVAQALRALKVEKLIEAGDVLHSLEYSENITYYLNRVERVLTEATDKVAPEGVTA